MGSSIPNLRIRLFLFSLLVASPILFLAFDSYLNQRQHVVDVTKGELRHQADALADEYDQTLQQTRAVILALGHTLHMPSASPPDCPRLLKDLVSKSSYLLHLGVIDQTGQPICLSSPDYKPATFPSRSIIDQALAQASFAYGWLDGPDASQSLLMMAAPIDESSEQGQNMLIGLVDLAALSRPVAQKSAASAIDSVLFDQDGHILPVSGVLVNPGRNSYTVPTRQKTGLFLSWYSRPTVPVSSRPDSSVSDREIDGSEMWLALAMAPQALQQSIGAVQIEEFALAEPVLYVATEIRCPGAHSPLFLGVSMPKQVAYEPFNQLARRFVLSLGAIGFALAAITWFGGDLLVKRQAEAILQQSEQRYRHLFNKLQDGFALHEIICAEEGQPADYRFLEVNPAFEQIAGLQASELLGKSVRKIFPNLEPGWFEHDSTVVVQGKSSRNQDDTQAPTLHYKIVAFSPKKNQLATIFRDVTAEKRAEIDIRRHTARAEALLRIGQRLHKLHDLDAIFQVVCEETAAVLSIPAVSISAYDAQNERYRHVADIGLPPDYAQRVRPVSLAHLTRRAQRSPATIVNPDGSTMLIRMDVLRDKDDPNAELYAELNVRSIVSTDLLYYGERIGRLTLHVIGDERRFGAADLALLRGLAYETTQAIVNARLINQIRQQAEQLEQIVNTVPEGLIFLDRQYRIVLANEAAHAIFADLYAQGLPDYLTRIGPYPLAELRIADEKTLHWHEVEFAERRKHIEAAVWPLTISDISPGWLLVVRDVTLERQERKAQQAKERLATVGQLAAGIAHDFNNILTPILLYTETTLRALPEASRNRQNLSYVLDAANRARTLVAQILIFSRRGAAEEATLAPIQPVLTEVIKLLRAVLPATVEIRQQFAPDAASVMADPTHIHQIVMNLCTNAHHAMRDQGGRLTIGLEVEEVTAGSARTIGDLIPGSYICIRVADTGVGIDANTLEHIFEPFFTTRSMGDGTGMGLSVVYGIVKGSGGYISVQSEPGQGSEFRVYMPSHRQVDQSDHNAYQHQSSGHEHVLVVDDEAFVVAAAKQSLEELGYQVTALQSAEAAIEVCTKHPALFAVAVIDQIMPKMTGIELAGRLLTLQPSMPIILMSGTNTERQVPEPVMSPTHAILAKPFTSDELSRAIRRVLDTVRQDLVSVMANIDREGARHSDS